MQETEEKTKKKLESRKFIVWLVWAIITVLTLIYCLFIITVTKQATESMTSLLEKVLSWFFGISMMYLGCNAGQKVGFAFADALNNKVTIEEEK